MAFVYIPVPYTTSLELLEYPVPGEKSDLSRMHVTLISFDQDMTDSEIEKIQRVLQWLHREWKTFDMCVKTVGCFPNGSNGFPVIGHIEGDEIRRLRNSIAYLLSKTGVEFSTKFPEFNPHATLSYAKTEVEDRDIQPIQWTAGEMVFDTGSRQERKTLHTYFFQKS